MRCPNKTSERLIAFRRAKLANYDVKSMRRIFLRGWKYIESGYGRAAWDWPTLFVIFPDLSCWLVALQREINERIKNGSDQQS